MNRLAYGLDGGDMGGPTLTLGLPGELAGGLAANRFGLKSSSSFLMREVMSKPRNGFWSVSLVGEVINSLESPAARSGEPAGLQPADPSKKKEIKKRNKKTLK